MKVWAKNEEVRRWVRHIPSRKGLGRTLAEGGDWPNDGFTIRRIEDGDVLTEPPSAEEIKNSVESIAQREADRKAEVEKFLEEQAARAEARAAAKGKKKVELKAENLTADVPSSTPTSSGKKH